VKRLLVSLAAAATVGLLTIGLERSSAEPVGFSGRGFIAVQAAVSGSPLTLNANIAVAQRGPAYRLDVLSVSAPAGGSPGASAANGDGAATTSSVAQVVPPGGLSAVYDQAARRMTVWSPSRRTYTVIAIPGSGAETSSSAAGAAQAGDGSGADESVGMLGLLAGLHATSVSLTPAGHAAANGHPTTLFDYDIRREDARGSPIDVRGRVQLADDLGQIPVELTAGVSGVSNVSGTLRAELTSVDRTTPPASSFAVPTGYTRVDAIGDLLGRRPL
jgi:hypothetical protein